MFYNQITKQYQITNSDVFTINEDIRYVSESIVEFRERADDIVFYDKFLELIKSSIDFTFLINYMLNSDGIITEDGLEKVKNQIEILTSYYIQLLYKKDLSKYNIENINEDSSKDFIHLIHGTLSTYHSVMGIGIYPTYIHKYI